MLRRTAGACCAALMLVIVLAAGCGSADPADASVDEATDLGSPDTGRDLGPPDLGAPDLGAPDPTDAGPQAFDLGPLHEITELTVDGRVALDFAAIGARVQVATHCGGQTQQTLTDDNGDYAITTSVEDCQQLVVEFTKESYLPTYRVVHLPPPATPVTMDVTLTALKELQCGSKLCVAEGDSMSRFPPGPMTRGWISILDGAASVDYLGGEFRDTLGRILWVTGFAYLDFRDDDGARLDSFEPFPECFAVSYAALDQIVDERPETEDTIEMSIYTLDTDSGRWESRGPVAWVGYTEGTDADNNPIILRASRDMKGDIRSNQLLKTVWVCADIDGSGWYAWGVSVAETACIALTTRNQCERPVENVVFRLKGRDYGFLAETWTDRLGTACLEAARSEPLGEDYNSNELKGETFWVDANLNANHVSIPFNALEIPREPATCLSPDGCIHLEHTLIDYTISDCSQL